MKFYDLRQKVYDWYKEHLSDPLNSIRDEFDNDMFITDGIFDEGTQDQIEGSYRIYKGKHLLGDAYVPQVPLSATITKGLGQIKGGSTVADLIDSTKGSMSAIMDKMLCPNYASVYHDPYFVATSTEQAYYYVGDLVPNANISQETTSQAINANPNYSCNGGPVDISKEVIAGANNVELVNRGNIQTPLYTADDLYKFINPGMVTMEYTISSQQGPKMILDKDNTLKDSDGNNTNLCALESDVLMADESKLTSAFSIEDEGVYVLAARERINPIQFTYFSAYPVYRCEGNYEVDPTSGSIIWHVSNLIRYSAEESYNFLQNSEKLSAIQLPFQRKAIILVPHSYVPVELYMEAHNQTFSSHNIVGSLEKKDSVRVVGETISHIDNPLSTDYDVYMFNDKCLGDSALYQIKIMNPDE